MTQSEFWNLEVGDIVIVTAHGRNKGKKGEVAEISRSTHGRGPIYLKPLDGEFEFYSPRTRNINKDGLFAFSYETIALAEKRPKKEFYIGVMFGESGPSWPADNFTHTELKVIERFLKEFNEHAEGLSIDCVAILDADDEDEE